MAVSYQGSNVYGPLKSRRLGNSLGVNLVPYKSCTLNCIYCEAGATTNLTIERQKYISIDLILGELKEKIREHQHIDYITLCGTGEPTLNLEIGQIIQKIKTHWPQYRLCLITNSTLLIDENLHQDLLPCDLIIPSLDAVSEPIFQTISRPHPQLMIKEIIEGLINFRQKFKNQIWLEIFFIEGINDTPAELALFKETCLRINPDLLQINSLDRNGTLDWVAKLPIQRLQEIQDYFFPFPTMIIGK